MVISFLFYRHIYLSIFQQQIYFPLSFYISPHSTTLTINLGLQDQYNFKWRYSSREIWEEGVGRIGIYLALDLRSRQDSPIISPRRYIFNFPNYQHPFYYSSKHAMFTIEEFGWGTCDEELGISESW
jgi:hypothetical protein